MASPAAARRLPDTGRVFVRHAPNLPSGGQVADIEIGAFLIAAGNGPEKQELLRLIGRTAINVNFRASPTFTHCYTNAHKY